ncbi:L-cysteine desulfhydrase-like [Olea europaea var. sylvestris]|uniref:L-cysteine desulfhydrase-like n=1 Tax=Olea europaea var. sylvestris TaxID=158386 RepID=UPI000C1D35B9|nr:L-cysteine desulfhydrase-like [Olea europaea var. sylvestris]
MHWQPGNFFFNHLQRQILHSHTIIKDLINADHVDEVSIVDNATTTAAIVLQNVGWAFADGHFQKGDAVVMLHCAFQIQAVKKSIEAYVTHAEGSVIVVHLPFPMNSNEEIIVEFRKGEEGVERVFVDAAHAIGCVHVDVKEIGADICVSNLHKWFFCPPYVAFLYCHKSHLSPACTIMWFHFKRQYMCNRLKKEI